MWIRNPGFKTPRAGFQEQPSGKYLGVLRMSTKCFLCAEISLCPKHGLSYIQGLDLNFFSLSWRLFSWKPSSFKITARCRKLYYRPIKFVLELLVILFSFENLRFFRDFLSSVVPWRTAYGQEPSQVPTKTAIIWGDDGFEPGNLGQQSGAFYQWANTPPCPRCISYCR